MLNMNSPTVQNLMQSGFNPYNNSGYVPQQQQGYYGYNPYIQQQPMQQIDPISNWEYSYDPMPKNIVNQARGINTQQNIQPTYGGGYNYYNNQAFQGYTNPFMMKQQIDNERIRLREEAIQQGKIWRTLLQNELRYDEDFDIDGVITNIESMYYYEPPKQELSMKERIAVDKNANIAQLESRLLYYKQNNIPVPDSMAQQRNSFYAYYNRIDEVIGDPDNCDIVDYFNRVYPELKHRHLMEDAEKYNKNLKNRYNSKEFNQLIDQVTGDRSDSYYYKLMESFGSNGVALTNNDGTVITADEMEIKLPARLLKNSQDDYYERRKKFYNSVFSKEG